MALNLSEKSYALNERYCNFYTGGEVAWTADGSRIYCHNTVEICAVDVATGQVMQRYGTGAAEKAETQKQLDDDIEEDIIYAFAVSPNDEHLVTSHRSGLLRLWHVETAKVLKLWKAQHKGPVLKLAFSASGKLICSSGAESTLRIWDFINSACVGVLKNYQGPAGLLTFHPDEKVTELYAAGSDNAIYCWNYVTKELVRHLRGHLSHVTGLSFENSAEGTQFIASVSRDKVLIIWQLSDGSQYKVIPMYEELEGVYFLRDQPGKQLVVASNKGSLKLVGGDTAKITTLLDSSDYEIKSLLYCRQQPQFAVIAADHNILIYDITEKTKLTCRKQLIGFNDEILDLCYLGENDQYLAVATNSKNIKIYDTLDNMNCKILTGHKDIVLTLSSPGASNFLLSSGKDLSIKMWQVHPSTFELSCVATYPNSHTSSVGSVTFGYNSANVIASVSQDGSLKVWQVKPDSSQTYNFNLQYSAIAHEKEVNSVAFAPNNKMLATGSQDKTAKLWSSAKGTLIGTLRGHTRSVWCVRFSPVDQVLLTSSADCSLRLWSVGNLACLKRFEQDCSILRADFIDHGKFIVTAGSDGLIKVWNIKTNNCAQTLDGHADRIWSLAISHRSKRFFYSGGDDSHIIKWEDVTEKSRDAEIDKRQELLEQEQTLQSLLQQKKQLKKAFMLALRLGKPRVTYNIIKQHIRDNSTAPIKEVIAQLSNDQRNTLLEHVKAWSTNSRHCQVANLTLHYVLKDYLANPAQRTYNTSNMVEVLTPYVQRHFKRMNELSQELAFLDFIVECI